MEKPLSCPHTSDSNVILRMCQAVKSPATRTQVVLTLHVTVINSMCILRQLATAPLGFSVLCFLMESTTDSMVLGSVGVRSLFFLFFNGFDCL